MDARRLKHDLEHQRRERQHIVVRRLFDAAAVRPRLAYSDARDILWSLTSREPYDGLSAAPGVNVPALFVHSDGCVFPDNLRLVYSSLQGRNGWSG